MRQRNGSIFRSLCFLGAGIWLATSAAAAGTTTVTGRLLYGSIDESLETGEQASIFDRGLASAEPIQFVRVELRRDVTDILADSDITDENGEFTLTVTQSPETLRVKARNDYVRVKRSKDIPLPTDSSISVDFDIGNVYGEGDVDLGDIYINDGQHTFQAHGNTYGVSRALFVATSIHRAAKHIEALTGASLGTVWVRLGYNSTAWFNKYLATHRTIYLQAERSAVIDHEYGHFIEDEISAFGVVPSYLLEFGRGNAHGLCMEQNLLYGTPDYCWSYNEGVASLYGAINSFGYQPVSGVPFFGEIDFDGDGVLWEPVDAYASLGDNWWIEDTAAECDPSDRAGWSDPRAVESVIAQTLWDLLDSNQDANDVHSTGIPEVAQIGIDELMELLTLEIPPNLPCLWAEIYTHPATLEQICEEYVELHREDTEYGVFPDLYIAYAFNGVDLDCARDTGSPEAVRVTSGTHPAGSWSNSQSVSLTLTDRDDDFSGSFFYYDLWDQDAATEVGTAGAPDFTSKETTNQVSAFLGEGSDHYYHVQTRDVAGHLGTTAHFGPVRIDITPPYFNSSVLPSGPDPLLIGTFVYFEWDAADDLSGVSHVEISFNGSTAERSSQASGSYDYYLDPDVILPTDSGLFTVTVLDRAGNSATLETEPLQILSPFDGPHDLGFDLQNGRVASGDLDGDGTDELVVSGVDTGSRVLRTVQIAPTTVIRSLTPGLEGGDLFLADADLDGDLDIVAAGDYGGSAPEIRVFQNDGTGLFPPAFGSLAVPTYPNMVVRVVDLHGTGEPILVWGGDRGAPSMSFPLDTYNLITGALGTASGASFLGGDFEVGDVDGDEYHDFVTLGLDVSGDGSLRFYRGGAVEDQITWSPVGGVVELRPQVGDVDLGNFDRDADMDLFTMYRQETDDGPVDYTLLWKWWGGTSFEIEIAADPENRIAEGDGHIVEIYNDGYADVFAMGRQIGGAISSWYETNAEPGARGSGVPVPVRQQPLYDTDTAWGDFDGDGDLDVAVIGTGFGGGARTMWYESMVGDYGEPNAAPDPPTALSSDYDAARGGYVFSWSPPGTHADETAETSLRYELRVGTVPGAGDIVSWAHPAGPSQQVAGVLYASSVERFVPLPPGTYFWTVRSVDLGWRRSGPAIEQSTASTSTPCSLVLEDCNGNGTPDGCEPDTDGDGTIDGCDPDDDNDGRPDPADADPIDPYVCNDADGDGCDDCAGGDGFGPQSDADPTDDGPDADADGLCDPGDPCPSDNPDDSDGDGVCDSDDVCHGADDAVDSDGDGTADGCDPCPSDDPDDSDGDGVCDSVDACPGLDDTADRDGDGVADGCDPCPDDRYDDSDGDGVCDSDDVCRAGDDTADADGDGFADACDPCPTDPGNDSDRDAVCDSDDVCPGGDDYANSDTDGLPDDCDNCPAVDNIAQGDLDGDGVGDACDNCAGIANPTQEPAPMPASLMATAVDSFDWGPVPVQVLVARGSFATSSDVGAFNVDASTTVSGGTLPAPAIPTAERGFWYLLRPGCAAGSYSSGGAGEQPGRDESLP